jgi:predicted Zn finger-like uncharacterized protein
MLIGCPSCKTRFRLNDEKIGDQGVKLRCTKCRTLFRVRRKSDDEAADTHAAGNAKMVSVLMAHESPAFCATVSRVLANEQIELTAYNDGRVAYDAIRENRPDVVLLDVALPSMYGFEICEEIRKDEAFAQIKIILIASIYDKTRYKRNPQSLYGADDYIEKHHIPDDLAAKIFRLVSGQKPCDIVPASPAADSTATIDTPVVSGQELDAQEETRRDLQMVEQQDTAPAAEFEPGGLTEAHLNARKLARIIASDIALYNQAKVEEGVRNGTFFMLLSDDISEGLRLFAQRVSPDILNDEPYLNNAFKELILKVEKELGI